MRNANDKQWRMRFINDPGHAWLVVPLVAIYTRGLEGAISHYSYMDAPKGQAYLEEDADAPLFLQAIQKEGIEPVIDDIFVDRPCFIRKLSRFRPAPTSF